MKYRNLYHLGPFPHIKSMFPLFSGSRYDRRCQNDCLTVCTIQNHIKSTKKKEELLWIYNCNKFCRESGKMLCILVFGDPPRLFHYYDGREGGLFQIYYNITYSGRGGGFPNSLQYYIGGGGGGVGGLSPDPDSYYVIYGRPHRSLHSEGSHQ